MVAVTDAEAKWRVYCALIEGQPLTTDQVKRRVARQFGLVFDPEPYLSELRAEGLAGEIVSEEGWWRGPKPDTYMEMASEVLWQESDENPLIVTVYFNTDCTADIGIIQELGEDDWESMAPECLPEDGRLIFDKACERLGIKWPEQRGE